MFQVVAILVVNGRALMINNNILGNITGGSYLWHIFFDYYVKNSKRQAQKEKHLNRHPHGPKHQRLQPTLSHLPAAQELHHLGGGVLPQKYKHRLVSRPQHQSAHCSVEEKSLGDQDQGCP
jgi:hypothetical protein